MKIAHDFSHLHGYEVVHTHYPHLEREVRIIIGHVGDPGKTKMSKEKGKKGRMLYAPKILNQLLKDQFRARGWEARRVNLATSIPGIDEPITGYKEIDFVKERVAAEVQFGKYFSMHYDLQKFQYFFNEGQIDAGIEILPMRTLHREMSSGVSCYQMLVADLIRMGRTFPPVPVWIIGIAIA